MKGFQTLLFAEGSGLGLVQFPAASGRVDSGNCWIRGAGGTWQRMRLTKKTASSLVRGHGVHHVFGVLGGTGFVLLTRLWVQGLAVVRVDVCHCISMVVFLGKELGNCP